MVSIPSVGAFVPAALVLQDENFTGASPSRPLQDMVRFESWPPEGITEGYNADYVKQPGRAAEPYARYWQGGDWNPINIVMEFRAGLNRLEVGPAVRAIGKMVNKVNWLKAAAFPKTRQYQPAAKKVVPSTAANAGGPTNTESRIEGQAADPPLILFVWGSFMTLRGRIVAWTVTWKPPYEPFSGKPHGALVSLTFQPESGFYPNWYTVSQGSMPNRIAGKLL